MSTHIPGFQSFFSFLHYFVLVELATISIRVKVKMYVTLILIKEYRSKGIIAI